MITSKRKSNSARSQARSSIHPDGAELRKKARAVFTLLHRQHADAKIELNFQSPLDLLVATILSAQCTDVRVNTVTPKLFSQCKVPDDYLALGQSRLEKLIQSTGFFRQKAKNIIGAMKLIRDRHDNSVPDTMEELVKLPGVGRKTANVVLGNAFGKPGLPVDTHVRRLTNRIGLTQSEDPEVIERELQALIKPTDWCQFSHVLIFHGRRVCNARKPNCERCSIRSYCNYFQQGTFKDAAHATK